MATAHAGSRAGGRPSWVARTVITVVSLGAFAIAVLMAIRMFGCVQGVEFSPDTFQSRTFVYYEIPLIRVRVTGVYRDDISGVLQRTVAGDKFSPAPTVDPPRWHLVAMSKGNSIYQDDALIIFRYLQNLSQLMADTPTSPFAETSAAEFWRKWTDEHDELAQILWPAVVNVCRQDLYIFVPAMFNTAEQLTADGAEPSPKNFEQALNQVLAEQYTQWGDVRRGQGEHAAAIEFYTNALEHVADHPPALSGREKSHYSAGDAEKSKQDRARLKELNQ